MKHYWIKAVIKENAIYTVPIVAILIITAIVACIPKEPISPRDIEILEGLSFDGVQAALLILTAYQEGRLITDEEAATVERILAEDIESFKAVMQRIKASEGESLAYKLLEKILLGLM